MSIVETILFLTGWVGWLVAIAFHLQAVNERESAKYWMRRHISYKRENPPRKPRKVVR